MIRILVTIRCFEPGFKVAGPYQYLVNMLYALNQDYFFYVFTSNRDWDGRRIRFSVKGKHNVWQYWERNMQVYFCSRGIQQQIFYIEYEKIKPDILYINGMFNWCFSFTPLYYVRHPNIIWAPKGDLNNHKMQRGYWPKYLFLKWYRHKKFQERVLFHAMDEEEVENIKTYFGAESRIQVAGNIPWLIKPVVFRKFQREYIGVLQVGDVRKRNKQLLVLKGMQKIKYYKADYLMYGLKCSKCYFRKLKKKARKVAKSVRIAYKSHVYHTHMMYRLHFGEVVIFPAEEEDPKGYAMLEALSYGMPLITGKNGPFQGLKERKAGLNIDLNPEAIYRAVIFFVAMNAIEFLYWSKGAAKYARSLVHLPGLIAENKLLFRCR